MLPYFPIEFSILIKEYQFSSHSTIILLGVVWGGILLVVTV